jgi:hypothetical protein
LPIDILIFHVLASNIWAKRQHRAGYVFGKVSDFSSVEKNPIHGTDKFIFLRPQEHACTSPSNKP